MIQNRQWYAFNNEDEWRNIEYQRRFKILFRNTNFISRCVKTIATWCASPIANEKREFSCLKVRGQLPYTTCRSLIFSHCYNF